MELNPVTNPEVKLIFVAIFLLGFILGGTVTTLVKEYLARLKHSDD